MLNLVIGGGGFIGAHLVAKLLEDGGRVRVLDWKPQRDDYLIQGNHQNLEWVVGDFSDENVLQKVMEKVDVVFHLASTTQPNSSNEAPLFDIQTNLVATVRFLDLLKNTRKVTVIYISSGGTIYGKPQKVPLDESHPNEPRCSYGIVKLAIEKYLSLYHLLYGINYRALRLANPYGPGQEANKSQGIIGAFASKIMNSQTLEVWGDGSIVRDYIYISDAISAIQKAVGYQGSARVFNVGSGCGYSVREIITAIERASGKSAKIKYSLGRPFDVPINVLDIQLARNELMWEPTTSLNRGLESTIAWLTNRHVG